MFMNEFVQGGQRASGGQTPAIALIKGLSPHQRENNGSHLTVILRGNAAVYLTATNRDAVLPHRVSQTRCQQLLTLMNMMIELSQHF